MASPSHRPDPPRVSERVRSVAYHLVQPAPFGYLARTVYESVAKHCAIKMSSHSSVKAFYLRGGASTRCAPVLSDLDFSIGLNLPAHSPEFGQVMANLAQRYAHLKHRFFLPGEVLVHTPQSQAWPNPLLAYAMQGAQRWKQDEWVPLSVPLPDHGSLPHLAVCLQQWLGCLESLRQILKYGENSFWRARFDRDMAKLERWMDPTTNCPTKDIGPRLGRAFTHLNALAAFSPSIEESPRGSSPPEIRAMESAWKRSFERATGLKLKFGFARAPFVLLLEPDEAPTFFERLALFFRNHVSLAAATPIQFLSPALWEAYRCGWSGWTRAQAFHPDWFTEGPSPSQNGKLIEATKTRLLMRLPVLLGESLSPRKNWHLHLKSLCEELKRLDGNSEKPGVISLEKATDRPALSHNALRESFWKAYPEMEASCQAWHKEVKF